MGWPSVLFALSCGWTGARCFQSLSLLGSLWARVPTEVSGSLLPNFPLSASKSQGQASQRIGSAFPRGLALSPWACFDQLFSARGTLLGLMGSGWWKTPSPHVAIAMYLPIKTSLICTPSLCRILDL